MTGHQINSLVGDLVAMAQAMERVPELEAAIKDGNNVVSTLQRQLEDTQADLAQSCAYVVSLQAKLHEAEVAKDAAETMFLEADDRTMRALDFIKASFGSAGALIQSLEPVKPAPEVKAESASPLPSVASSTADTSTSHVEHVEANTSAVSQQPQGQSEPDPTFHTAITEASQEVVFVLPIAEPHPVETKESAASGSWVTPSPQPDTPPTPPAQPYLGQNYFNWPAYVPYDQWIAGGGTHDDYYERRQDNRF